MTLTGLPAGVRAPRRLGRPFRSMSKRCVKSRTSASEESAYAFVSLTPTVRANSAHVAISAGGGSISSSTDRVLTFNGSPVITIPAGALVVSDPITLNVPALGDVAVSLYLPENVTATTEHTRALQTTYISQPGDFTGEYFFTPSAITQSFYFLTGVEVSASKHARAIVAFGDSETDGLGSTPDTNHRWPNLLAERLQSNPSYSHLAVVAAGVSGNRILNNFVGSNGLSRFDRDALVQTGVKYVIVGGAATGTAAVVLSFLPFLALAKLMKSSLWRSSSRPMSS